MFEQFKEVINKNRLQIIHEDNNTFTIEDLKYKRSLTRGKIIRQDYTKEQVEFYLQSIEEVKNEL